MALLSTYQKFKEKNTHGGQSEPQKQETQKENSGSGLMSTYQQFMSKKQGGTQAVSPAQDYNQRVWDVLQRVDSVNANRNGAWSADVTGGNGLEINALLREYDAYEGDKSGMTDYRNMLLGYNKQMQELNGYYSKFRDSDDYDRQRSGYENFGVGYSPESWGLSDSEARDIRKQQSQKDAQESQRALAEYTAAKKEFEQVDSEWRAMDDRYRSFTIDEYDKDLTEKWQAAKKRMTDAENSLLGARNRMDAYNATWGKIDQYAGDAAAAKGTDTAYRGVSYDELTGWENRRQEEQAAQDAQAMMPDHAPGALKYTADTEPQVDDALGLWRSMTQQQRQDAVSSSNGQLSKLANEGAASYWDLLTDDEVSTYYYIRNQRGQEAANQYLEDMYIELTRRNEAGMVQGIENASALEKTGMVAASVGANLLGAIPAAMGTTADLIAGRKNPYSSSGIFKRYASYVRGTVGQDISDWTEDQLADKYGEAFAAKAGELANQTFQAFMSGVDSVAGGKFFGQGLGIPVGPFDMHVGGYTTVMGLGAFADRAQEMQLKGATTAQIALGAIGSGVLEALFEDVSMEAFFTNILDNPATTLKEFTKKLAVQMGVEASEEVFTEIGNILWDGIVMGKNSDTETATREYMSQGMTEQEARQRATLDNIQDIVWAGYGGAISAGAMAVGGQALSSGVNRVHSTVGNYAVGSQLLENGRAVDLQEQAESLTNEKKRAKLQKAAAEVANKASAGDKSFRNTYRTGKVATQIAQQAGREARGAETAEFRKAAEKYLEGQRGIQNKKHALNVLTRAYDGTATLPGDKAYMRMIGGEKLTQEILNSVGGKETLQENAKPSVEASMRTIGNVQSSVLGIAPETKAEFDSDNSGQAFRKSDSEPINILASEPIARVENGILYLNTDDGQEIAASDVSYGNSGEAAVYAAISNMQTDTETARSLLSGINDSGLSSAAYARAIRNAYYRGMNGVKFEDTPGYSDAAKLPEAQRRAAWEAGKQRRAAKVQAQEALIDSGKAGTRESGVTMQESAKSIRSLNKQQQTGMAAAKALAAAGLHVEVYASTEAERKAGKPNGIYRKADGSIAIDLNAGDNGQGAVAYALAHETTHFIKDYSPAKYEAYAQLIIAAAENKGISYDSLIARQMARLLEMEEYKGLSETELQDIAYDETIAEMSETILTDTDAANRLSQQIYKQDRTLWQKIKDFFTGLVEKLRNAYKDSDPDSDIGRMLKRAVQDNAEIAQAWAEAVAEAGENYQLQDGQKKNARKGVRYSLRGTTDGQTVAVVDEDILSNIDLTQWNKQTKKKVQAAAKEALKKFSDGIVVDGITRNVNKVSRNEYTGSKYSEKISKTMPQLYADKMRAASAIDDVVIAATDWARDGKLLHPRTDNFVDFDHGNVLIEAGRNQYVAEVVVGITDRGNAVFYDVVDIQPTQFTTIKEEPSPNVTTNKSPDIAYESSSDSTVPQQAEEVKENVRYSSRNTRDSDGNQLTEDQARYFENSRVRDDEGNLKVVYHGSPAIFTEFSADFMGTHGSAEGQGFYFTDYKPMAEGYLKDGGQLLQGYLNIQKPLSDSEVTLKRTEVRKLLHALDPTGDDLVLNYDSMGGMGYPSKAWYNRSVNDTLDAVMNNDSDSEILGELANAMGNYGAVLEKARDVLGYDGYIVSGKYDDATVYVAFDSSQFKNADNQNPTEAKDIRFSDRNSQSRQVERLEKKNAELKAEAEYLKQVVNVQKSGNKAHILDRSSVNAIGKGLMESVNAKGSEFGKLLNDFYRALGTEDMSYETMQDRAGELADWLLEHHQAERDGYAQDILDFLKKRRVSLSDGQIGDIEYSYGSLNDFKQAIKGSIILDQNAETSLDQLWQEAAAQFPDRFGADVTENNMPDGLAQIVSWANSTESSSEAEFQYYRAEQKADLTQKILMGYLEAKPMESVSDNMKKELEALKEQHKKEIKQLRKEWDAEAAAMEKSHAYDLEAEKKRGAAAIDAMKAAQAAIDKANAALWEVERNEIKLSYDRQMAKLRTTYSTDTAAYQNEFFEALKSEEYKDAKSPTLRRMLKELANEKSDGNKDAETSRKQVYENLRQQYELEKDIGKLEAKVKQQREAAAQKVESRKKTEERHKLQNTIDTLNKYLLQPTNTAHVPQGLQSSVAMALRAINGVIGDSKAAQNADRLAEYAYRLRELEKNPSANEDKIADLNRKIQNLTGKDSSMKAALAELQEQYHKLETQGDSLYDSNIEALIQNTMEQIGDTEYRNLSLQQLKAVRDSYTALLTTIRNANKAFVAGKNARIDEMVKRATTELSLMKKKKPNQTAIGRNIEQFFWNNEKPVYAFERIGSAVMSELYDNLRKGEDTFYRDVSEARDFFLESAEKNDFSKWNLNELKEFTAANGQKFQLSLDELMSLYAYSLRPQAREHLTKGGIVLGENTKRFTKGPLGVTRETTYNDANAYTLTDETIDAIAGSLTKEQRQFAFEMQQYLAKIMGAKGDEVNMALYGIKKFGEETYWPLKSSDVFSERVRAQQENPGNKLKNKGFTKALTPKANNAIELSTLTETWAEHVSDMSMYHSFTLPMEDFYRVYNWNQKGDGKVKSTMGVRQLIQKTAGKGAVNYIDQFLKDLNGGLRADPRETVSKAMLSGFKKAAVSASLSVAIQQPSAVGRALAYIEPKYFIGSKVEGKKFAETWEQLKKYAAVAGLKEMGRFDVDMGRSTLEYIIGRNGLSTWGKITDKVDEYSGWLPEMADQVTWCAIWEAAKRKTQAQNPGLHGEALLQKAGELFTNTITRTQVYDSVFSRSANMRAKSGLMSMATAFMAEPTTTANMVEDAVRKFARGDKRMAGKVLSSVAVATVLNAALASVVYAARDDDDDKTYWEKYMASLAGETVDSLNPLTYIPVLSDINNLLLGYSIERTDMSLASDLITALKKITTLYGKYDDEWSDEEKKEWKKKVRTAWLDNAWMVGTVMDLPLKNVVRDVEAVINTARNPSNGAEMNADTVLKAMGDSARKNFPILSWKADESSSDQLYKAITQGKDVLARRLKAQFGDEKKYESALLKGLRENDPRIKTAAQYAIDGNTPKRVAIIREIVAEGHYTQDQVIKAINQKANSMKEKTQSGKESPPEKLYDYSEYVNAAANGLGYAGDVQKELIRYQADRNQEADGKLTRQEAESDALKTFQSNVKSDAKDGYAAGELTEAQVRKVLTAADIAEDEELDDLILQWDTELELGDEISWSNARYLDYAETIHPAGISADTYDSYIRAVSKLSSIDEDGDGKTDITKQEQVIEYIDSMLISAEQKDALFQAEYPKARKSVLRKLPWR